MKLRILATLLPVIFGTWLVSSVAASAGSPSPDPNGKGIPPAGQKARGVAFGNGRASAQGILAKLKNPANPNAVAVVTAMNQRNLMVDKNFALVPGLQRLVLKPGAAAQNVDENSITATIQELLKTGLYEYVEPDWVVQAQAIPSDAAFTDGRLWGLRNTGQSGGTSGADISAVNAWDITTGSTAVVVAVIDTGIRYTHQDLAANMWRNPGESGGGKETNGIDDDANGYIDDVHGINAITGSGNPMDDDDHGSHCSGTIGAVANGGGPHVGVAWNVRLMGLKFLGPDGGYNSDAITCINYAVARGAKILSNSWGGYGYSQGLYDSIAAARDAGVLFVAAAGNETNDNDSYYPAYPSSYDLANIVSVAALDRNDQRASFSNYGSNSVDLGAPGVDIYSCASDSDTSYKFFNGTSMAAPHVAGAAALLAAARPNASYVELKQRLLNAARPVSSLTGNTVTGAALNAHSSLVLVDRFANGSFEQGHNFWTTQGNLTYSGPGGIPGTDGSRCTVFNNGQRPPNGVISQSFTTGVGVTYTLDFKVGVLAFNTLQQRLRVTAESAGAATLLDNTTTVTGGGGGSTLWTDRQFQFTATSSVTTLRFTDVSTETNNLDLLLDNVRVTGQQRWNLTVNAVVNSPSLPVAANVSASPLDLNGLGGGATPYLLQYNDGQVVTLSALGMIPPVQGYVVFFGWLKNGVFQTDDTVVMTADTTMTAYWGVDSPPYITSPSTAEAIQNAPFQYRITAENFPTNFSTSPLPPGLSLQGDVISGIPTAAGNYTIDLTTYNGDSYQTALALTVLPAPSDYLTESFSGLNDTGGQSFTFVPDGSINHYRVLRRNVTAFPTDPAGGQTLSLTDDSFAEVGFQNGTVFPFFGELKTAFFVGSNGYVTFGSGDSDLSESLADHFSKPRIAALFDDLNPSAGGLVSWKQSADRMTVTFEGVPEFLLPTTNSFQIEMFFDGRIRITILSLSATDGLIGLSRGLGEPLNFTSSNFSGYPLNNALVSLFANGTYVDLSSDNTQTALENLGYSIVTFTGIGEADWNAAFAAANVVVIPSLNNPPLVLSSGAISVINAHLTAGKGLVVMGSDNPAQQFLNNLRGWSVSGSVSLAFGELMPKVSGVSGFANSPANLVAWNSTYLILSASLPTEAQAVYQYGTDTSVFVAGPVAYLGYDWWATADPTWTRVLADAITAVLTPLTTITQALGDGSQSNFHAFNNDYLTDADLTTANGFSDDAFDGVGRLSLSPAVVLPPLRAFQSTGPLTSSTASGTLSVERRVSLVSGRQATDEVITVTNTSGSAQPVTLAIADNYGSDSDTQIHRTSSGDATVTTADRWFISNDVTGLNTISGDPTLMVSWGFSGNLPAPTFPVIPANGNGLLTIDFGTFNLAAGQTTTVTIRRELFDSAQLALANGLPLPSPQPEIAVEQPAGWDLPPDDARISFGEVNVGSSVSRTVTIRNIGSADLILSGLSIFNSAGFTLDLTGLAASVTPGGSTTFTVTFTPSAVGTRTAQLQIENNDADENPFDITLTGTGVAVLAPEIVVEQPAGTNLIDNAATLACGSANLGSSTAPLTVTIRNTGSANLTGLAVTKTGSHASDYTLGALGATTLAPGASTTFTMTFTPSAAGPRTAALQIASNDADENPFDIALTGTGIIVPEIAVEQPVGTNLVDNAATLANGSVNVGSSGAPLTVTIRNPGSANLTGLALTKTGSHASDFTLGALGATTLAPGATTTFTVTFAPSAGGLRTAALQIASNDADENPFDIALTGTGDLVPEIAVEQPVGTNLIDNAATLANGSVNVGSSAAPLTVTIRNPGSANLTGLALSKIGSHASDYTLGALGATTLAPGASTTFSVTFAPSAGGLRTAALQIASNDADENPFDIALTGTGIIVPEIVVEQPAGTNLIDNAATLACGSANVGSSTAPLTVTIRNTGSANLTSLALTKTGTHASDFTLGNLGATTLAPGASATFTVAVTPSATGTRTAALQIASNDADENPFDIALTGTGGPGPATSVVHSAPSYRPASNMVMTVGMDYAGLALSALGYSLQLPAGWSYVSDTSTAGVKPVAGETGTIEWAWFTIPAGSTSFSVTLLAPSSASGNQSFSAVATLANTQGIQTQIPAAPNPLAVPQLSFHTVDVDSDNRYELTELLSVVSLYNYRDTITLTRTGEFYRDGSTYRPGPGTQTPPHHSTDLDQSWRISLTELLSDISLYNYREGTVRTGEYHYNVTSGRFVPGPAPSGTTAKGLVAIASADLNATLSNLSGPLSTAGGVASLQVSLAFNRSQTSSLGVEFTLPSGWSMVSETSGSALVKPDAGQTGELGWAWSNIPTSPLEFVVTVSYPPAAAPSVITGRAIAGDPVGNQTQDALSVAIGLDPYYVWADNVFAGAPAGVDRSSVGDPDLDGFANLLEYALGTDPRSGADVRPFISFNGSGQARLSLTKGSIAGLDSRIRYTVEASTVLDNWSTVGVVVIENSATTITADYTLPADRVFLRLSVTKAP